MSNDRREDDRYKYAIDVTYVFGDGTSMRVAKSSDICHGGMSLLVGRSFEVNDMIRCGFAGSQELFEAKVVWCQKIPVTAGGKGEDYQIGIKYEQVIAEKVDEILKELGAYEG